MYMCHSFICVVYHHKISNSLLINVFFCGFDSKVLSKTCHVFFLLLCDLMLGR